MEGKGRGRKGRKGGRKGREKGREGKERKGEGCVMAFGGMYAPEEEAALSTICEQLKVFIYSTAYIMQQSLRYSGGASYRQGRA